MHSKKLSKKTTVHPPEPGQKPNEEEKRNVSLCDFVSAETRNVMKHSRIPHVYGDAQ